MSAKHWALFVGMGLLWGSSFMWIKIGVVEMAPFSFVAMRMLFSLFTYLVLAAFKLVQFPQRANLGKTAVLALFNMVLPFSLITYSEQIIPSGIAAMLNSTSPLFAAILSHFFLPDDRLSTPKVIGLAIGFSGVVLLASSRMNGADGISIWGIAGMLAAAFCFGAMVVYTRRNFDGTTSSQQAFGQTLFSVLFIFPVALAIDVPFTLPQLPISWVAVVFLGVMSSALNYLIFYYLIHAVGGSRTSQVSFLVALVGGVLGVAVLGEHLTWQLVVGGLMIIAGIIVVNSGGTGEKVVVHATGT
ncbi:MAG: DMT family transporter [Anaerolineae bacterium]|nr:DMT family transporter [Anaerolineae bacterium]